VICFEWLQRPENVLAGYVGIVMRDRPKGPQKWDIMSMGRLVRGLRQQLGLPATFDACRHGGMTELEEAELTDGKGRALSAHRSKAYDSYAKRTAKRALAATRKRHAHKVAIEKASEAVENSETVAKSLTDMAG
jgi:hypothetical protein